MPNGLTIIMGGQFAQLVNEDCVTPLLFCYDSAAVAESNFGEGMLRP